MDVDEITRFLSNDEALIKLSIQALERIRQLETDNTRLQARFEALAQAAQAVIDSINDENEIDTDAIAALSWELGSQT